MNKTPQYAYGSHWEGVMVILSKGVRTRRRFASTGRYLVEDRHGNVWGVSPEEYITLPSLQVKGSGH
jgi:hypothetical protein